MGLPSTSGPARTCPPRITPARLNHCQPCPLQENPPPICPHSQQLCCYMKPRLWGLIAGRLPPIRPPGPLAHAHWVPPRPLTQQVLSVILSAYPASLAPSPELSQWKRKRGWEGNGVKLPRLWGKEDDVPGMFYWSRKPPTPQSHRIRVRTLGSPGFHAG